MKPLLPVAGGRRQRRGPARGAGAKLFRVNLDDRTVRHYEKELQGGDVNRSTWIENLFRDSQGHIWIRAASGFSVYLPKQDKFVNFPAVSEDGTSPAVLQMSGALPRDARAGSGLPAGWKSLGVVDLNAPERASSESIRRGSIQVR
ncbi:MAG: hypothetical protein H6558_18435 [Lewinellaceae bacterium]|nr:hypothetical protein [Lewinellaceae bacterium]